MIVIVKMDILDNNSLVNPVSEVINYEVIKELDEELSRFFRGQQKHTPKNHKSNKVQHYLSHKKNKK